MLSRRIWKRVDLSVLAKKKYLNKSLSLTSICIKVFTMDWHDLCKGIIHSSVCEREMEAKLSLHIRLWLNLPDTNYRCKVKRKKYFNLMCCARYTLIIFVSISSRRRREIVFISPSHTYTKKSLLAVYNFLLCYPRKFHNLLFSFAYCSSLKMDR